MLRKNENSFFSFLLGDVSLLVVFFSACSVRLKLPPPIIQPRDGDGIWAKNARSSLYARLLYEYYRLLMCLRCLLLGYSTCTKSRPSLHSARRSNVDCGLAKCTHRAEIIHSTVLGAWYYFANDSLCEFFLCHRALFPLPTTIAFDNAFNMLSDFFIHKQNTSSRAAA